jgi:hypothetical protein
VACGGSAYAYSRLFGRDKPAPRSPFKIIEDLNRLAEQGIHHVFLFQDPRILGQKYCNQLLDTLARENTGIKHISIELFYPCDKDFLAKVKNSKTEVGLSISPESGVDSVRLAHGRDYTNDQLLRTLRYCKELSIPVGVFFMVALGNDTWDTIGQTMDLCEVICQMNFEYCQQNEMEREILGVSVGPMILLDPGSLAFDNPGRYGYKPIFNKFMDYFKGLSRPSWHQWISYETKHFDRMDIFEVIIRSLLYVIALKERYGFDVYGGFERNPIQEAAVNSLRFDLESCRFVSQEIDRLESVPEKERVSKLFSLRKSMANVMMQPWHKQSPREKDTYSVEMRKIMDLCTGLMRGD